MDMELFALMAFRQGHRKPDGTHKLFEFTVTIDGVTYQTQIGPMEYKEDKVVVRLSVFPHKDDHARS